MLPQTRLFIKSYFYVIQLPENMLNVTKMIFFWGGGDRSPGLVVMGGG